MTKSIMEYRIEQLQNESDALEKSYRQAEVQYETAIAQLSNYQGLQSDYLAKLTGTSFSTLQQYRHQHQFISSLSQSIELKRQQSLQFEKSVFYAKQAWQKSQQEILALSKYQERKRVEAQQALLKKDQKLMDEWGTRTQRRAIIE